MIFWRKRKGEKGEGERREEFGGFEFSSHDYGELILVEREKMEKKGERCC